MMKKLFREGLGSTLIKRFGLTSSCQNLDTVGPNWQSVNASSRTLLPIELLKNLFFYVVQRNYITNLLKTRLRRSNLLHYVT